MSDLVIANNAELDLLGLGLEELAGLGNENVGANDIAGSWFKLLQATSPEVKDGSDQQIDGATAGMLYESTTKSLIDIRQVVKKVPQPGNGLRLTFASFVTKVVVWGAGRTGWKANHDLNSPEYQAVKAANLRGGDSGNELVDVDGNSWVETQYHLVSTGEARHILPMAKSNMGEGKKLNSVIASTEVTIGGKKIKPPRFLRTYTLTSVIKQFPKGDAYVYSIVPGRFLDLKNSEEDRAWFEMSKQYAIDVRDGKLEMLRPPKDLDETGDAQEHGQKSDVPF